MKHSLEMFLQNKKSGKRAGRQGLSERVFCLVDEFNKPENRSYKNAMVLAGKLKAIAQAAEFDGYWSEKTSIGFNQESNDLTRIELPAGTLKNEKGDFAESFWIK